MSVTGSTMLNRSRVKGQTKVDILFLHVVGWASSRQLYPVKNELWQKPKLWQ